MSQQTLAEAVGKTTASISDWERGKHFPSVEDIYRLAHILDVRVEKLFAGVPLPPPPTFRGDTDDDLPSDAHAPGDQLKTAWTVEEETESVFTEVERQGLRAARLRHLLRTLFNEVFDAAGADLEKLGWLKTQLLEHMTIPPSWGIEQDVRARIVEVDRKFDQLEREAAAKKRADQEAARRSGTA